MRHDFPVWNGRIKVLHEEALKEVNGKPELDNLSRDETIALRDLDDAFAQARRYFGPGAGRLSFASTKKELFTIYSMT